ncbi:MAG: DUF2065 domain-containing protein [Rickettsiales bacterium]
MTAVGLVLVIEGAIYALFPAGMQRMMAQAMSLPPSALRLGGLIAAVAGFWTVWFVRG